MRHFLTLEDITTDELTTLLDRADEHRRDRKMRETLKHQTVVILLEKASTRTRLSFEVGAYELGARPSTLISAHTQLGRGEPIEDTAKMLSGYAHAVVYRTFGHERVTKMAEASSIPVINALTDEYHPCQLLADMQTIRAEFGRLEGLRVAWIGDGNNMAHSWMLAAARGGFSLAIASPEGYDVDANILAKARALGAEIHLTRDPREAASGADVVTTDVWASMGQEEEQAIREKAFDGFIVDDALMRDAKSESIFLHCLPAHRGEEVSASVMDSAQSRVWAEAENRLHAQKALLELLAGGL